MKLQQATDIGLQTHDSLLESAFQEVLKLSYIFGNPEFRSAKNVSKRFI